MKDFYSELVNITDSENVKIDESMAKYTTFRAGGNTKYLVEPSNIEEMSAILKLIYSYGIKSYVMGNGSNLLVRDSGFDGIIVKIGNKLSNLTVDGNNIACDAGVLMSKLANTALENGLTGMEFGAGIPGTIGGAVTMNAGAYDGEIKDIIIKADILDDKGNIFTLSKDELELGYRTSIIQKKNLYVVSASFELKEGDREDIKNKMNQFLNARKEKQPLEYPSAGSTFKRPQGHFAGKLIMDAGLAGYGVNGACVSRKHCGFIINQGNATATDIIAVIENVSQIVYEKYGVKLEPEVKIL